jgi:P-type conjugative transfer protein TrbJ
LQTQATGAQGQMEAIQAANQLASAQTNQLLQIRSLLVANKTLQQHWHRLRPIKKPNK